MADPLKDAPVDAEIIATAAARDNRADGSEPRVRRRAGAGPPRSNPSPLLVGVFGQLSQVFDHLSKRDDAGPGRLHRLAHRGGDIAPGEQE